jgi:hypothetical protein
MKIKASSLLICLFLAPLIAFSATVGLEWDKSPDSTVVGYKVYYGGQPGNYVNNVSVLDTNIVILTNLTQNVTYYFAVKSVNAANHESIFSSEVSYTPIDSNVYVYLVFKLKYGTNLTSRTTTNIDIATFINPPPKQTYSGTLIITNRPAH